MKALIRSRLPKIAKELKERERQARIKSVEEGASVARQLAPVDTGRLRSEISVSVTSGDGVVLESPTPYAVFVEYGTTVSPAQPYFTPGLEVAKQNYAKRLKRLPREIK